MQVRKLIRLLQEASEKHGDRTHVSIDARRYKNWRMDWDIDRVNDLKVDRLESINPETGFGYDHGQANPIIILNPE